jgi:hypothetical protein
MTSYGGFCWPESGPVACDDWDATPQCGGGLHGLLWGQGNGSLLDWSPDARWLVIEVASANVVDIGGKVKFPSGTVVYCGDRAGAIEYIARRAPLGTVIVGHMATAGDYGMATAGDRGTICIWHWDDNRRRLVVGYVGEGGIEPGVMYRVDADGNFVRVTRGEAA